MTISRTSRWVLAAAGGAMAFAAAAQLVDVTQSPNALNEGIHKSLAQEVGAGRGDAFTSGTSSFLIQRDPFRAVRRGRQLFMRKFTRAEGQGPRVADGVGDIGANIALGAGLADSCASCHARPRGGAGFGGDVATRPDSRGAPHLFGLGIREMLADEMTGDLRRLRAHAAALARRKGGSVTLPLATKGIGFGAITARRDGSFDTSGVVGVDPDLRVRPFNQHGNVFSIREFINQAAQNELGLQAVDPDLMKAHRGGRVVTPAGLVLDGAADTLGAPPTDDPGADPDGDGVRNELPESAVDFLEFYLLNYFTPGNYKATWAVKAGRGAFDKIGCARCHVADLPIEHDRRVANVETKYDPVRGIFNGLFAEATKLVEAQDDGSRLPPLQQPAGKPFLVQGIYADFRRHDLGAAFHERSYDGTTQTLFMTAPLWGVGTKSPFGHDGRSANLTEVILRHGGEAQESRDAFAALPDAMQLLVLEFLRSLVLFPPDDTASNLDPGNPAAPGFPQVGHGSIKLTVLFNDPTDVE